MNKTAAAFIAIAASVAASVGMVPLSVTMNDMEPEEVEPDDETSD